MKQLEKHRGIIIFYSYASADGQWRDQLAAHLSQLKRDEVIEELYDHLILPGGELSSVRERMLHSAQIILLLISADFLNSDACQDEMQQALECHRQGKARVVPVIVRPCAWQHSPVGDLQPLPRCGKPIAAWKNPDEAFLSVVKELRKIITQPRFSSSRHESLEQQNRVRLLKQVQSFWIEGLLEQSLHRTALIDLDLQEQPDALENPWQLQVQELERPPHLLPRGTSIVEVYDQADGELLILGEPGSGKTTLLLQLARTLLDRAEADEHLPIPVVFNLSSWSQKQGSLATWLIEELKTKYRVPYKVGQHWIETDELLLLLDGLDEVTETQRSSCIEALQAYRKNHALVSVVVCSRKDEYLVQAARLVLERAVVIQSLSSQQIDEYLSFAGGKLETVREVIRTDPVLQEMVQTPLMLSIVALTYQEESIEPLLTEDSLEMQRRLIFAAYVQRMLKRRGSPPYPSQQIIGWLQWLARLAKSHNKTQFTVEWIASKTMKMMERTPGIKTSSINLRSLSQFSNDQRISQLDAQINLKIAIQNASWYYSYFQSTTLIYLLIFTLLFFVVILAVPPGNGFWSLMELITYLLAGAIIGWLLHRILVSFIPRLLLWQVGIMPLNYRRFLDVAAERLLLRKVGVSYIFMHRLLLEYFAALDDPMPSESASLEDKREK
jgi:TIR domain/NACHT domain